MTFKLRSRGDSRIRIQRGDGPRRTLNLDARLRPRPLLFIIALLGAGLLLTPLWLGRKWQALEEAITIMLHKPSAAAPAADSPERGPDSLRREEASAAPAVEKFVETESKSGKKRARQ